MSPLRFEIRAYDFDKTGKVFKLTAWRGNQGTSIGDLSEADIADIGCEVASFLWQRAVAREKSEDSASSS
jgi:hypothetical protein